MKSVIKAIETTGRIIRGDNILLDEQLPVLPQAKVRIIILVPEYEDDDISEIEWLRAASKNPVYDFLKEPEEDIYTLADGKPFND